MMAASGAEITLFGTKIRRQEATDSASPAAAWRAAWPVHRIGVEQLAAAPAATTPYPAGCLTNQGAEPLLWPAAGLTSGGSSSSCDTDLAPAACQPSVQQHSGQHSLRQPAAQHQHPELSTASMAALRDAAEALQVLQGQLLSMADAVVERAAAFAAQPARQRQDRHSQRRTSQRIAAHLAPGMKLCSSCRQVRPLCPSSG